MKIIVTSVVFASLCLPALAQESQGQLDSGLAAMGQAQAQDQAQAAAEERAQEAAQAQAAAREEDREAAAQRRQDAANAAAAAAEEADKKRDQGFQDQERQLVIEQQEIELQKEQTDANRENDIVNAQLAASKAQTDVTQSEADTARVTAQANASATIDAGQGAKALMTDTGKAEMKKSGGFLGLGGGN